MFTFRLNRQISRNGATALLAATVLLTSAPRLHGQGYFPPEEEATKVFLPIITNQQQNTPTGSDGAVKIRDSGRMPSAVDTPSNEPVSTAYDLPFDYPATGPIKAIQCSIQDWKAVEVRDLQDRLMLDANAGVIYPGALVQGKDLENGLFTPLTIPRAGGRIWVEGLKLAPDAKYYATLPEINGPMVKQAVEEILSTQVQGTAARANYEVNQTYSFEHLLFTLGIDGRYGPASVKANLKVGNEEKKNYVFLKFAQVFYDVYFEDPQLSTTVFRDGERFQDPENQIYPGNPPLYVQKVSYGRIVFFVAESDYSAADVQATLEAAYNRLSANIKLNSGLTYKEVMERTKVYYAVAGGSADLALQPIDSATPSEMYDKVKDFLINKEAANFSASNPGVPIAYTLRYLANRNLARMSYSVAYGKKDCKVTLRALATVTVRFTTAHIHDDGDNWPSGAGEIWFDFKAYGADNEPSTSRYPDTGYQEMDSGNWYPIERTVTVNVNEDDKLIFYVTGNEDDSGANWQNDALGTVAVELGFDTQWGTYPPHNEDYQVCARNEGEYCMHYRISVDWTRPPQVMGQ